MAPEEEAALRRKDHNGFRLAVMNLPVQFKHILTASDFAFVGIPKDCDLLTVHVPTRATFAHTTNGRTIFEFKGVQNSPGQQNRS